MRTSIRIGLLLFGSGMTALIYQTVWLREFRLIFGGSTAASAAVLAIFMGGLGLGGLILGPRADRHKQPLMYYATLEAGIALSAAATPFLLGLAGAVYIGLGGTTTLGESVGSLVRLGLATLVLAMPTFLMGGTLPAAARAAETESDLSRRGMALLYGLNTLGAVTGAVLATFALLEIYGNRLTLWLACLVNLLVVVFARVVARSIEEQEQVEGGSEILPDDEAPETEATPGAAWAAPSWFVLTAAAVVGFAFLVMELVWYRMLGPILGGSTFTFGLILALALLGIGLGGAAYSLFMSDRPTTLRMFALTCAAEALLIAIPFAFGDRIAVLALLLRPLGALGFVGFVSGWATVGALVILPAAFVAGVQFPMLIALLGSGRTDIGRHVGYTYALNTAGAIVGSLAGGFGLMPALTAPGTWRLVVLVLALLSVAALALQYFGDGNRSWRFVRVPGAAALGAVLLLLATGPTAAWRHSGIGAGRDSLRNQNVNGVTAWSLAQRRKIIWEREGVESSVALAGDDGLAFIVNGKVDGHAIGDAPTQVMSGLLGALISKDPRRALVVGLGTGSTAGWLASIDSMERVDVAEIEPAIAEVARQCAPVNRDVMTNPKVSIFYGDAREFLLATREQYDVIFSEPSNPYRAGIASLFTTEYYQASKSRLTDGGLFVQWVQSYEVDGGTVSTVFKTLGGTFDHVDTWHTTAGDLILVASDRPIVYDVAALRARAASEPFRSALAATWRVDSLEGIFSHFVANNVLARAVAETSTVPSNTDDHTVLEFAFGRTVGQATGFSIETLRNLVRDAGLDRPTNVVGDIDWALVSERRVSKDALAGFTSLPQDAPLRLRARVDAARAYAQSAYGSAVVAWRAGAEEPRDIIETSILAHALAASGDDAAVRYIDMLRPVVPVEAEAILGTLRARQQRWLDATASFEQAFVLYRSVPWAPQQVMRRAISDAVDVARAGGPAVASRLYQALSEEFSVRALHDTRLLALIDIGLIGEPNGDAVAQPLLQFEPYPLWNRNFLTVRRDVYSARGFPLASRAAADFLEFVVYEPRAFAQGVKFSNTTPGSQIPGQLPADSTGEQPTQPPGNIR